jgi:hypothetical protein
MADGAEAKASQPFGSVSLRSTLSNSPHCKRQLPGRHLLADSGIDQMRQGRKPVKRFEVLRFYRFQPNARLQSDELDSVMCFTWRRQDLLVLHRDRESSEQRQRPHRGTEVGEP